MSANALKKDTEDRQNELDALARMRDEDIDLSDIPELTDEQWKSALKRGVYRPVKQQLTLRLDADVVEWFKRTSPKYQTAINDALRKHMNEQRGKNQ
ncbi:MAG TPA: BrnA antitoxin family protein [Thermomicrobiales bacterium]|nr:BrnA antitoxin family protein [Thermomicrobiales bacterium]